VKSSPKDYQVWLKSQDEAVSAEAERRSTEGKRTPKPNRDPRP